MNDTRLQGIDQQHLTDALDREDGLKSSLEAAQKEIEHLNHLAIYHSSKLQELNSLLEAECAKTSTELITRQTLQKTARHHRAETLEAQRKEKIANQHCEAAESEISRLQREIATSRSTTATANRLLRLLREDLALAETHRQQADEQLDAVTAEVSTLRHALATSTDRVSLLEQQAQEMGEIILTQHQRVEFAEKGLRRMAHQLEDSNIKLCDSMERYDDLEAVYKQSILSPAAATAAEYDGAHANKHSLHTPYERDDPVERACIIPNKPRVSNIPPISDYPSSRTSKSKREHAQRRLAHMEGSAMEAILLAAAGCAAVSVPGVAWAPGRGVERGYMM